MIQLTAQTQVLLATRPADFRRGIDGFVAVCQQELKRNPRSGTLFVFINRRKTMIRALSYDGTGFWLMTKRLSKGRFTGWPSGDALLSSLEAKYLARLLQSSNNQQKTSS